MLPQEVIKQIKKGIANAVENKAITKDNLTEYLEQSGISPANDTKTTEEWLRHLEYAKDVDGEIGLRQISRGNRQSRARHFNKNGLYYLSKLRRIFMTSQIGFKPVTCPQQHPTC